METTEFGKLKLYAIFSVLFFLITLVALGFSYVSIHPHKDTLNEISKIKTLVKKLNESYGNLSSENNDLQEQYEQISELYSQLQYSYEELKNSNVQLSDNRQSLQNQVSDLESQNLKLKNEVNSLKVQLK